MTALMVKSLRKRGECVNSWLAFNDGSFGLSGKLAGALDLNAEHAPRVGLPGQKPQFPVFLTWLDINTRLRIVPMLTLPAGLTGVTVIAGGAIHIVSQGLTAHG